MYNFTPSFDTRQHLNTFQWKISWPQIAIVQKMTNMRYVCIFLKRTFRHWVSPLSTKSAFASLAKRKRTKRVTYKKRNKSNKKTRKEKNQAKNPMTLFLPICQVLYDVTWSAGSPEQAQLLPICCEQPLLSTWVLQVTYHPSTFSKKYILILSGILWQFISKVHLGTHLGTKPPITRPPLEQNNWPPITQTTSDF